MTLVCGREVWETESNPLFQGELLSLANLGLEAGETLLSKGLNASHHLKMELKASGKGLASQASGLKFNPQNAYTRPGIRLQIPRWGVEADGPLGLASQVY